MSTHQHQHMPTLSNVTAIFAGDMARTYHLRTGDCNIALASHLISLLSSSLPPSTSSTPNEPLRILDNASGPLVLTNQCLTSPAIRAHKHIHISAVDISPDFVAANKKFIEGNEDLWSQRGWKVDAEVMDGMDLRFEDETFDLSFTSLALFAFPDPVKGAKELYRTLKPGGAAALTTWKRVGWSQLLKEAEDLIKPGHEHTTFPFLEPWFQRGKLEHTLKQGGFQDVIESDVLVYAWWDSVEEAAKWMTTTLRLMVGQSWSEDEKGRMEGGLAHVMRGGTECVRFGEGGKVGCEMVAWTAVGRK